MSAMFHAKKYNTSENGFSFIELLLVVAIVAIIAASSAPFISRFLRQNELEVATDKTVSVIRKAQSYAMSGKDNDIWGFCYTDENIRLYRNNCTSPVYSEDFDLSKITVSGLTDISFSGDAGKRGEPSSEAVIIIENDAGANSVSINYAGGISLNQ